MTPDVNGYTAPAECDTCEEVAAMRFCGSGWYQCEFCGARVWVGEVAP